MPDIPGIISVVTAGIILVVRIISVVIGGHFGCGLQTWVEIRMLLENITLSVWMVR